MSNDNGSKSSSVAAPAGGSVGELLKWIFWFFLYGALPGGLLATVAAPSEALFCGLVASALALVWLVVGGRARRHSELKMFFICGGAGMGLLAGFIGKVLFGVSVSS